MKTVGLVHDSVPMIVVSTKSCSLPEKLVVRMSMYPAYEISIVVSGRPTSRAQALPKRISPKLPFVHRDPKQSHFFAKSQRIYRRVVAFPVGLGLKLSDIRQQITLLFRHELGRLADGRVLFQPGPDKALSKTTSSSRARHAIPDWYAQPLIGLGLRNLTRAGWMLAVVIASMYRSNWLRTFSASPVIRLSANRIAFFDAFAIVASASRVRGMILCGK